MATYGTSDLCLDLFRVAASAGISTGLFHMFGKGWIGTHFQRQLQLLKHQQDKELENVRLQVQLMHGRVSKIHEREFTILPKAWLMLHEAYGWTARTTAFVKQYPDVCLLSDEKLQEMLTTLKMTPVQIAEIMASPDRHEAFVEAYDGRQLDYTKKSLRTLNNYILENQIFLDKNLGAKFKSVIKDLMGAVTAYEAGKAGSDADHYRECMQIVDGIKLKVEEIQTLIQKRLHYEEAF